MYIRLFDSVRIDIAPQLSPHSSATFAIPGKRQQTILSVLAMNLGETVSVDRLVDALWPISPPPTCREQVQNCTAAVRRFVRSSRRNDRTASAEITIVSGSSGYKMIATQGTVDVLVFEEAVRRAVQAPLPDVPAQRSRLRSALNLWTGAPFAGTPAQELQADAVRLEELRLVAIEELVGLELGLNISPALHAAELLALTNRHPFRERLRLLQMEALRLCGRRAEALAHYRDYRTFLVAELGIEPGLELRKKEREVLHDSR